MAMRCTVGTTNSFLLKHIRHEYFLLDVMAFYAALIFGCLITSSCLAKRACHYFAQLRAFQRKISDVGTVLVCTR